MPDTDTEMLAFARQGLALIEKMEQKMEHDDDPTPPTD